MPTSDNASPRGKMTPRHIAIVVCCCLTTFIPAGMLMNTPGIFYPVIAEDLGVQTAQISAWMAICLLSAALFQPIVGNVVSRVSVRLLMLAGALCMVAVFLVFSRATAPWMFWVAATVTGIPFATCVSVGPATLVNRWFARHVGLLLGVFAGSMSAGGVVFLLVGQAIIEASGWRAAYLAFAAIILVACVPAILLGVRDDPEACGLRPYGAQAGSSAAPVHEATPSRDAGGVASPAHGAVPADEAAVRRRAGACMRTPAFFLLLLAGFLMNMICQVNAYLPKYVYWLDDQAALGLASASFLTGVVVSALVQAGSGVGKVVLGAASDLSVFTALALLCGAGAVGLACVWLAPATPLMAVGGFVFGFFLASVLVLVPMLVRAIFGAGELYPVLYARVAVAPSLGGATANIVWPYLADNLGGFDAVFGLAIVLVGVVFASALVALRLPRRGV